MRRYLAQLTPGRIVLWCYLIWYLVTVANHFDPSPAIWLNSLGISAIIGVALRLSVNRAGAGERHGARASSGASARNDWQTFRLFLMPFCVSSFAALIKGQGYVLVFPARSVELFWSAGLCAAFVILVLVLRKAS
jgi:hypothetical protein